MEKTVSIRNTEITFSIWDLGGTARSLPTCTRCAAHVHTLSTTRSREPTLLPSPARLHPWITGQREFVNMLPLVCNDAHAILFMFDLSRKSTLNSIKEWFRQARGFNKVRFVRVSQAFPVWAHTTRALGTDGGQDALAFLIGTKYDRFHLLPDSEKEEITTQVLG